MRTINNLFLSALLLFSMIDTVKAQDYPYTDETTPTITSTNAYLIDIDNGQVIWSFNGETEIYPASMTKVMTAVIALETLTDLEERITITDEMWAGLIEADASVAGFWPGDAPTVRELLYGVLLPSGADAVNALAIRSFGSVSAFVEQMNRKAAELGMDHTHFANPTGLHDDTLYASLKDISILMTYALENATFAEILATPSYTTGPLASAPDGLTITSTCWPVINQGEGSFSIPGFLGGKTGYTPQAGRCLVSHAQQDAMHMVLVTAGSQDLGHIQDASTIYNWYFDRYSRKSLMEEGSALQEIQVLDAWENPTFTLKAPSTVTMDLPKDAVIEVLTEVPDTLQAPVEAGDELGILKITADGQLVHEEVLYAADSYRYSGFMHIRNQIHAFHKRHPVLFWIPVIPIILVLGYLILYIRYQIRRARRRRRKAKRRQQTQRKTRT